MCDAVTWNFLLSDNYHDRALHHKFWTLFGYPSVRKNVPTEELAIYEAEFNWCRRIDEGTSTFEEIETNASQVLKRFGLPHEDRPVVSAEETEAPENEAVQNLRGDTTAMSTEKLR